MKHTIMKYGEMLLSLEETCSVFNNRTNNMGFEVVSLVGSSY